jgi:hypothetical protein
VISEAEQGIWRAVLVRALRDCAGIDLGITPLERPHLQRRARAWFSSDELAIGSFGWICEALGLDAGYLRARVLSLPAPEFKARVKTIAPIGGHRHGRRHRRPAFEVSMPPGGARSHLSNFSPRPSIP